MRRWKLPALIPITLALMTGIALECHLEPGLYWIAGLGVGAALLMFWRTEAVLLAALALGMFLHHWHRNPHSAHDIRFFAGDRPDYFELEGWIAGDPVVRESATETRVEFPLTLRRHRPGQEWLPASGTVLVQWRPSKSRRAELFPGDQIRATGYLSRPSPATNPYLFDYRAYLSTQGIEHILEVDRDDPPLEKIGAIPGAAGIFKARKRLEQSLLRGMKADDEVRGLLLGMVLGERAEMADAVNEDFRKTGTLHVVAISGLHITLIAFLVSFMLRLFQLSRRTVACVVIPFLVAYVVMTGCRASAVRALLMCMVFMGSWFFNRPAHLMNTLAAAALLILVFAPRQLFDVGFQLSFVVVAAIVVLLPRLRRELDPWIEIDPLIPSELVSRRRRRWDRAVRWCSDLALVSVAAWIGSAGLILYYFHLISPVSPLCNLTVVPLSSLLLALGFVAMGADFISPFLAGLFNETQWLVARLMLGITDRGAEVPGGNFYAAQPAAWAVVAFYLGGCAWLFWKKSRRWIECGAALGLATWLVWTWAAPTERASVLEVGAGQAVLLERAGGPRILIDAGTVSQARWTVEPFLRARGVNSLDAVIGTHGDASHVGGLLEILRRIPVDKLVVSPAKTRSSRHKQLVQTAREMGIPVREAVAGDVLDFDGMVLEVLWPKPPFSKRADENSLVLRHGSLVIMSDLPAELEGQIQVPPGAVIVRGSGGEDLFKDLPLAHGPSSVIFSAGDQNRDDLVPESALKRLEEAGVQVFITGRNGAVLLKGRPGGWLAEPLFPAGLAP